MATIEAGMRFSNECLKGQHTQECAGKCACGCHLDTVYEHVKRAYSYPLCCGPRVTCQFCGQQVGTFLDATIRVIRWHQCRHGRWCKRPNGAGVYCSACGKKSRQTDRRLEHLG